MIAVCVCTYKRPDGLKRLLDSLAHVSYDKSLIHVFIADNDAAGQAGLNFVETNKNHYPFPITAEIEEHPGISHARNRTLRMVKESGKAFDYIAITDDDVEVSTQWLHDLVLTADLYEADAVIGKREARFDTSPSREILNSGFFDDETFCHPTGTVIHDGSTSNVLFRTRIFDVIGYEPFDTQLSLSGGEDCELYSNITKHNFKMVQSASAIIYEIYPESRLNKEWILQRYFRSGSTYAYIQYKNSRKLAFYIGVLKKTITLAISSLKYLIHPTMRNRCKLNNTLGFFYFITNSAPFEEYKR